MLSDYVVRLMNLSDYPQVRNLLPSVSRCSLVLTDEEVTRRLTDPSYVCMCCVRESDFELAGYGELIIAKHIDGSTSGRLEKIVVAPAHRRLGLATLLCNKLLTEAKAMSVREIRLTVENEKARAIYEKLGFSPTDCIFGRLSLTQPRPAPLPGRMSPTGGYDVMKLTSKDTEMIDKMALLLSVPAEKIRATLETDNHVVWCASARDCSDLTGVLEVVVMPHMGRKPGCRIESLKIPDRYRKRKEEITSSLVRNVLSHAAAEDLDRIELEVDSSSIMSELESMFSFHRVETTVMRA